MPGEGEKRKKPPVDGLMLCVRVMVVSGVASHEFSHKTWKDCSLELSMLSAPWSSMLGILLWRRVLPGSLSCFVVGGLLSLGASSGSFLMTEVTVWFLCRVSPFHCASPSGSGIIFLSHHLRLSGPWLSDEWPWHLTALWADCIASPWVFAWLMMIYRHQRLDISRWPVQTETWGDHRNTREPNKATSPGGSACASRLKVEIEESKPTNLSASWPTVVILFFSFFFLKLTEIFQLYFSGHFNFIFLS